MISLSRLFKSNGSISSDNDKKIISIISFDTQFGDSEEELEQVDIQEEKINYEQLVIDAQNQANNLLEDAKKQVEHFYLEMEQNKELFEQEKQIALEAAQEQGFQLGLDQGKESGLAQYTDEINKAKEVIDLAKKDYNQIIQSSDRQILEIGLKVAQKIIGYQLDESNEAYLSIVKRVLKETREYDEVQLHVHPNMYGFILSAKEELMTIFPKEVSFYIFPNEDLNETDVFIEYAGGRIDAGIDSQLAEIKYKLMELLDGEE